MEKGARHSSEPVLNRAGGGSRAGGTQADAGLDDNKEVFVAAPARMMIRMMIRPAGNHWLECAQPAAAGRNTLNS